MKAERWTDSYSNDEDITDRGQCLRQAAIKREGRPEQSLEG